MAESPPRHLPNGRYTRDFQDHVCAWVAARGGRTATAAGHHFGVDAKTVGRWMKARGVVATAPEDTFSPETPAPEGPPPRASRAARGRNDLAGGRFRAPVEELDQEDRERAVTAVRNIAEIVELGTTVALENLKRARRMLEQNGPATNDADQLLLNRLLSLDKDNAQAMLHLSRTQGLIIDTHPGLLKLAGVKDSSETGQRQLRRVAEAFGLKAPEDSG